MHHTKNRQAHKKIKEKIQSCYKNQHPHTAASIIFCKMFLFFIICNKLFELVLSKEKEKKILFFVRNGNFPMMTQYYWQQTEHALGNATRAVVFASMSSEL